MLICHHAQMEESARVAQLAAKLRSIKQRSLARQVDIERETGVDQTVISRVINGHKKRMNPALQRLEAYANMLLSGGEVSPRVKEAAQRFLVYGTEGELIASIEMAKRLVSRQPD